MYVDYRQFITFGCDPFETSYKRHKDEKCGGWKNFVGRVGRYVKGISLEEMVKVRKKISFILSWSKISKNELLD